jgi:hypothetical protein
MVPATLVGLHTAFGPRDQGRVRVTGLELAVTYGFVGGPHLNPSYVVATILTALAAILDLRIAVASPLKEKSTDAYMTYLRPLVAFAKITGVLGAQVACNGPLVGQLRACAT